MPSQISLSKRGHIIEWKCFYSFRLLTFSSSSVWTVQFMAFHISWIANGTGFFVWIFCHIKCKISKETFNFCSIWWIIAFILLVYLCMSSILSFWVRWSVYPVIVSSNQNPMFIGDIPFPAVAICPETKFSAKKFDYTEINRLIFKLDGEDARALRQ